MAELFKLTLTFIETQGIVSFVVLAVVFLMYRQQNATKSHNAEQNKVMQGMIDNQATESAQQGKMLDVLMVQSSGISDIKDGFNNLTKKADDISKASNTQHQSVRASIDANTAITSQTSESVITMNEKFGSLEKAILEAVEKMSGLSSQVELSPGAREALIAEITNGLKATMKECLTEAIRTTQEAPVIAEIKHLQKTETKKDTQETSVIKPETPIEEEVPK